MISKRNHIRWVFILACAILCGCLSALAVSDWGLSFQNPGKPPVIDVDKQELKGYDALYLDESGEKTLYLTFDAGYENGYTATILDILQRQQVPAAFFVVGHYIKSAPELTKRMCEEGHVVANHTFHHPDMSKIDSEESFRKELEDLETLFAEMTGREMPRYYRPPQGKFSRDNLRMAKKLGYKTIFWSLAYVDWRQDKQPSREFAIEKLSTRTHPGAVILLHSTSQTNAEVLEEMILWWKKEGYRFGTLEELCAGQASNQNQQDAKNFYRQRDCPCSS